MLLTGDLANWFTGRSGPIVGYVPDARVPRVLAALVAGAALAVAGAIIQAGCRNPLAEPGILGVTSGAGLGAVLVITLLPSAGTWAITGSALAGAALASVVAFGLAARGGLDSDRLVLIGVGVAAAADALITVVIVLTDPWSIAKALTWLSGSTYGRTLPQVVPVAVGSLLAAPLLWRAHRTLDLLAVDDDTPRLVGVRLDHARPVLLGVACLLTALVGTPYFVWLLWRSRSG